MDIKRKMADLWRRRYSVRVLIMIASSSILIRLLMEYKFDKSALLYVGIPFMLSLVLAYFTPRQEALSWKEKYWRGMRTSLIIMLGSSVILFEGFICVAMFLPIYLFIVMVGFVCEAVDQRARKKHRKNLPIHLLPLLIFASALEGTMTELSQDRFNRVTQSRVVNLSIAELQENLRKPIELGTDMPWFLALFPMPYQVDAETLQVDDIHRIDYRYQRWFFTNTHEGSVQLRIAEVNEQRVRTQVINDSSYISNYLTLHGTEIEFKPLNRSITQVTLHIDYDRNLDPAWYFGPLQQLGVEQAANYLLDQVIVRNRREHAG